MSKKNEFKPDFGDDPTVLRGVIADQNETIATLTQKLEAAEKKICSECNNTGLIHNCDMAGCSSVGHVNGAMIPCEECKLGKLEGLIKSFKVITAKLETAERKKANALESARIRGEALERVESTLAEKEKELKTLKQHHEQVAKNMVTFNENWHKAEAALAEKEKELEQNKFLIEHGTAALIEKQAKTIAELKGALEKAKDYIIDLLIDFGETEEEIADNAVYKDIEQALAEQALKEKGMKRCNDSKGGVG